MQLFQFLIQIYPYEVPMEILRLRKAFLSGLTECLLCLRKPSRLPADILSALCPVSFTPVEQGVFSFGRSRLKTHPQKYSALTKSTHRIIVRKMQVIDEKKVPGGKMKRTVVVFGLVAVLIFLLAVVSAQAVPAYPGARVDDVYELKQPEAGGKVAKGPKVIVFTTNDLFENVVAYYRGIAREYKIPGRPGNLPKLPSGQELKEAYFILDKASDIATSKHWIKIQRPYLGIGQAGGSGRSGGGMAVREVTGIIEEDKRSYP
jgi:hypothetical protein